MPLHIIRQDITKIKCDAIVNPTNKYLYPSGGVDAQIHRAAGDELFEVCQNIGGLAVGQAKITPAYRLPCKYVIHTVGPWWEGGGKGEKEFLQSCYQEALKIAKATKCESIAFPLISSGTYGYPKDQALCVAMDSIRDFTAESDMQVYLVAFDRQCLEICRELFPEYI